MGKTAELMGNEPAERQAPASTAGQARGDLARLWELSPDPMGIADFHGYFQRVNPAFEQVLGYSAADLVGRPFLDFVHPDDRERTAAEAGRLSTGSLETVDFENRYRCRDGSYRWLRWSARSSPEDGLLYAVAHDVTGEKQIETEHAGLAAIVGSSDDAIVSKSLDGTVLSWNRGAELIYGYSAKEIVGRPISVLAPPERDDELPDLLERIKQGQTVDHLETVRMAKDGRRVEVSVTVSPVRDIHDRIVGASSIARDITERNRERRNAQEALERANKELESFSYSVSHDLRAPLRTIDGFTRILVDEYLADLPPEAQRYIGLVRSGTEQMGRLVDGLLSFSQLGRQELRTRPVSTYQLVQEALNGLSQDQEGRAIEFVLGDLPASEGDPILLKQVFVNLISNAIKFTAGRSPAMIEIGSEESDGERVWFVRDNGAGFDMRYAAKLFGVFQRLHREEDYQGTGIGLATVERIVTRHGGRIWAEAELDKGATFFFTLPKESDDRAAD